MNLSIEIIGHAVANADVCRQRIDAQYYRDGAVALLNKDKWTLEENNLTGVVTDLQISGNDIEVIVTGIAAKDISWTATVIHLRKQTA